MSGSGLTEAEIKLQKKYAELRKKKEQQKLKQAQQAAQEAAPKVEEPANALEKAKAILAQKQKAVKKDAATVPPRPLVPAQKLAPKEAAKKALEATKAANAKKRPSLKRPAQRNPAAKPRENDATTASAVPDNSAARQGQSQSKTQHRDRHGSNDAWQDRSPKRPRLDDDSAAQAYAEHAYTIFVGDLPPFCTKEDLSALFGQYGTVENVRLIRDQCFGFVKFEQKEMAEHVLRQFHERPLVLSGHELRLNTAHGTLPDWKRGASHASSRAPAMVGQHPKVLEAKLRGDEIADQLLQAGAHGLNFYGMPQQRALVSYDDL